MKIKDLPPDYKLDGVAFKHPGDGNKCYFRSAWSRGVWWSKEPNGQGEVFIIPLKDSEEFLDFELAEDIKVSSPEPPQQYLGDSVYINHDGTMFYLCTNNGYGEDNLIFLEPEVIQAFLTYIKQHTTITTR